MSLPSSSRGLAMHTPESVAKDHRKMPAVYSAKKMTTHIARWNAQQDELRNDDKDNTDCVSSDPSTSASAKESGSSLTRDFDYTDEAKMACLLCQRQFKTIEVLRRHVLESALHERNLQDDEACRSGAQRKQSSAISTHQDQVASNMKRANFVAVKPSESPFVVVDAPYRDRAHERRVVFGIERVAKSKAAQESTRKGREGEEARKLLSDAKPTPVKLDEHSVGGAMLAKMGWSQGHGLGSDGQGRTAPVEALVYAQGAGLGSHRGKTLEPISVEEHAAKRQRFVGGSYNDSLRAERMRQRFDDDTTD